MTNVLRLTEHPPLRRDQAFERLRDAIITGHFAPGARLEAAIVRRFAVEASAENNAELRRIYEKLSVVRDQGDVAAIVNTTRQFSEYMMGVVNHELISDIHQKLTA